MSATDESRLLRLAHAYWLARSLWVAAELGLPDLIGDRARTADEIATRGGLDPAGVERLLSGLTSEGYFRAEVGERFRNNPESSRLRSDVPGSMRPLVRAMLGTPQPEPWACPDGGPGLSRSDGGVADDSAQYWLGRCAELLQQLGNAVPVPLHAPHEFGEFDHVVDVGSGMGSFTMSLLHGRPRARATLLDRPDVAGIAKVHWVMHGMEDRVSIVGGDFIAAVPDGGDLYLLRFVLHEWPDDLCLAILTNIAQSAAQPARLVVVDPVRVEAPGLLPDQGSLTGHERSRDELIALLSAAGFEVTSIKRSPSGPTLIEANRLAEA